MKKALLILGGLFGILILLLAIYIGYAATIGPGLDKSSKVYIDSEVPRIIKTWNGDILFEASSEQLLSVSSKEEIDKLMRRLAADLGSLKEYHGSVGESGIHINNGRKYITAEYIASSTFEKGEADINITLTQVNNNWKILNFFVREKP